MNARLASLLALLLLAAIDTSTVACGAGASADDGAAGDRSPSPSGPGGAGAGDGRETDPWARGPALGARRHANGDLEVRVRAPHATRLELCVFAKAFGESERLRLAMNAGPDVFALGVPADALRAAGVGSVVYYGLRAFGPSWPWDPAWRPGGSAGFVADVSPDGDRMNPNKLLLDPYALEISHDPITTTFADGSVYRTGAASRTVDSGPFAPKGVVVAPPVEHVQNAPTRALRDDVIYEVHVRGFTKADADVPEAERGTYAGAARRAKYLRGLGVTAIELLPLHETPNDQNERTPDAKGDNYWGYSTLAYFAPDRRYAADRSPGGPTRELRAMVDAFHAEGIKVFVDVVFNHTAEGRAAGDAATLLSLRGLDARTFYELADDPKQEVDSNGVGGNLATTNPVVADMVLASLGYWHDVLGVDGFRFDLAAVVGNGCARGCYRFDRTGLLTRIAKDLPARAGDGGVGVDLVAEPWGVDAGTYQLGAFPPGWSEWNDRFRDGVKRSLNRLGVDAVTPREIARRLGGSADVFDHDGRGPAASIDYVASHDGMTLADLFAYDAKANDQPYPFGPSGGGPADDISWSHAGDPSRQRAATRTALALVALGAGVPMITGGDERLRTVHGNDNPYNLDSPGTWIDWTKSPAADAFTTFASRLFAFRAAHRALRPTSFWRGAQATFLRDDGAPADGAYLDAPDRHFLGVRLDGAALDDAASAIYVAYNAYSAAVTIALPKPPEGKAWTLVGDTSAAAEAWQNVHEPGAETPAGASYSLDRRTVAVFVAR